MTTTERPGRQLERTLPRESYLSPEVYAREMERIFAREWVCVARDEELPGAGDFLHVSMSGESVLIVRTRAGVLAGFYNVCRHRGSQLHLGPATRPGGSGDATLLVPTGQFKGVIRCPYHSWTYELDGELRNAPFLDEENGVTKHELPLYRIGVATWGGFVFVNLSPDIAETRQHTLQRQIGTIPEKVQRYPLPELRIGHRIVYSVDANWKVLAENYNECYHCGSVHPELCRVVPAFKERGGGNLDWDVGIPHRDGAWTFTMSGTTNRAPFAGLTEAEKTRHKGEILYPNLWISLAADHVTTFTLWPETAERTTIVCDFLFHPDEMRKSDYNPMDAVEFWDLTNRQDWAICESVQRGMRSRVFRHGYYAPMEHLNLDIRRYVADRMRDDPRS